MRLWLRKYISLTMVLILVISSPLSAKQACDSLVKDSTFTQLCKNIDDVLCKDVPDNQRRSCDQKDQSVVHPGMTAAEIYNFAAGCMHSAAKSFKEFFTEFLPELIKAVAKLTAETYELASNNAARESLLKKLKGVYESARALSADVYEAMRKNPSAYFNELWIKIVDAVGPLIAHFDCLKPQIKVEKICGFIADWVVPPALLAKVIVKGSKGAKELLALGKSSKELNNATALEQASGKFAKKTKEVKESKEIVKPRESTEAEKLAARLKLDAASLERQAWQLDELRLLKKNGHLKDPKKLLMLEALELRAPELDIVKQRDAAKVKELQLGFEDTKKDVGTRLGILTNILASNHKSREEIIRKAMNDPQSAIRDHARILWSQLGKSIDLKQTKVIAQIAESAQNIFSQAPGRANAAIRLMATKELKQLSDGVYLEVLKQLHGPARLETLKLGNAGRSFETFKILLTKANEEERAALLDWGKNIDGDMSKLKLVVEHFFTDKSQLVRDVAANTLVQQNKAVLKELFESYLHSANSEFKQKAEELLLATDNVGLPSKFRDIDTGQLLKMFDKAKAKDPEFADITTELGKRDPLAITKAMRHPDPNHRMSLVMSISRRDDPALNEVAIRAIKDPVDEVRGAGVKLLHSRYNEFRAGLLNSMANYDKSEDVRKTASLFSGQGEVSRVNSERRAWERSINDPDELEHLIDLQSFEASRNVYELPEFDSKLSPQELVEKQLAFQESLPSNFKVQEAISDPRSGYKAVHYRDLDGSNRLIISIGGTQTKMDVFTDMNVGIPQLKSKVYLDSVKKAIEDIRLNNYSSVILTGHSLGGAIAQSFAHDVSVGLKKLDYEHRNHYIEVVTWNGLGAVSALKRLGRYDEEVAAKINARNYYVEGDLVSRVGGQIGEVRKISRMEGENKGVISSHLTSTIEVGVQKGGLREATAIESRYNTVVLPLLAKALGWMGGIYQDFRFANNRREIVQRMIDTRQLWAEQYGYRELKNTRWLDKELEYIRKNAGRDSEWVNKIIDTADIKYRNTIAELQKAPQKF